MRLPISYRDDRKKAEQILLEAANRHTVKARDLGKEELAELTRRYFLPEQDVMPRVYYRLTDNWIELTVRFLAHAHGVRDLKDAMSREIIGAFDDAGIQIASSTYDVVGMPAIRVQLDADGSQTKHTAKNSKRQQRDVSHQTSHGDSSDSP
jgi:small-conductance mechanosensitive channel